MTDNMIFYEATDYKMPDVYLDGQKCEWGCTWRSMYEPFIDADEEDDYNTCLFTYKKRYVDICISDRVSNGHTEAYIAIDKKMIEDLEFDIDMNDLKTSLDLIIKEIENNWEEMIS